MVLNEFFNMLLPILILKLSKSPKSTYVTIFGHNLRNSRELNKI